MHMLELPGYELEPLRADAAGRWTMDVALPEAQPRDAILEALGQHTLVLEDPEMLLTGIMFGNDEEATMVSRIRFARDPHVDPAIATPGPVRCSEAITSFAQHNGLVIPRQPVPSKFRVVLGLLPGYANDKSQTFPAQHATDLLSNSDVNIRPGYYAARRYEDRDMDWDEAAVELQTNSAAGLARIAVLGKELGQLRFVVESDQHTTVYNLAGQA